MKDSGIEWIGEIPEEWDSVSLLKVLKQKITDGPHETPNYVNEGIPFISVDSLGYGESVNFDVVDKYISPSDYELYNKKTDLREGDILFTKSATIGKMAIVDNRKQFMIWSPIAVMKTNERFIYNKYCYYIMFTEKYIEHVRLLGTSNTQVNVGMRTLEKSMIPLPSLVSEQQKIANFLDQKCSEIDHILEKTRESIEEYKKLKQSIITEAVTKGLNRNVEMKESGIVWIGEIPKHWEVAKVKNFYEVVLGKMLCNNKVNDDYTLENYLCSQNIKWNSISQDEIKKMWFSSKEKEQYLLKNGDVVITEGGSVGVSSIYKDEAEPCYIQNAVHRARGKNGNKNIMLYYWMTLIITGGYMDLICNKATIAHYTKEKLENTPFLSIPILEQQQISDYLDQKCSEIDSLITQKETLITDLEAYKKSLIFECVTGKREVE